MTQQQLLLATLRRGPCTIGDLFAAEARDERGRCITLRCEYRARISEARAELRQQGGDIVYDRVTKTYTLIEPSVAAIPLTVAANGQVCFA